MTNEKIKRMFDACYLAKRIREMLPPLPQGVMPSYIQYMDKIQALEKQGICVKVSDISDALNIPRPGVTRTVKEMETKGNYPLLMMVVSLLLLLRKREKLCPGSMMSIISMNYLRIWMIFQRKMQIA